MSKGHIMDYKTFWQDILSQNRERLPSWFREDAVIRWHCSNEQFTVAEYVRVNCDYPNDWTGEIFSEYQTEKSSKWMNTGETTEKRRPGAVRCMSADRSGRPDTGVRNGYQF